MDYSDTPNMTPSQPASSVPMDENQLYQEQDTQHRSLNELYASGFEVGRELQNVTGDDTIVTTEISDYGNCMRTNNDNESDWSAHEDDRQRSPDGSFSAVSSSLLQDLARASHLSPVGSNLPDLGSELDTKPNKAQSTGSLYNELWKSLRTARSPVQSQNQPSRGKFLPRSLLISVCSFEAVYNELRPLFEQDSDAQRCTELICGKRDSPEFNNKKCSREIFAILVLIKASSSMPDFVRRGIRDDDLPFQADQDVTRLSTRHGGALDFLTDEPLIYEFYQKQWWVHVPFLGPEGKNRGARGLEFAARTVMPWTFVDHSTEEGGFGSVRKVRIHRDHHKFVSEHLLPLFPRVPPLWLINSDPGILFSHMMTLL